MQDGRADAPAYPKWEAKPQAQGLYRERYIKAMEKDSAAMKTDSAAMKTDSAAMKKKEKKKIMNMFRGKVKNKRPGTADTVSQPPHSSSTEELSEKITELEILLCNKGTGKKRKKKKKKKGGKRTRRKSRRRTRRKRNKKKRTKKKSLRK
jgi:hypothetical protein